MSALAYQNLTENSELEGLSGDWKVLEGTRSNKLSGFDAVTFVNEETNQAVIAFRGTELNTGTERAVTDLLNDVDIGLGELSRKTEIPRLWDDQITKFEDAVGITSFNNWKADASKEVEKFLGAGKTNQLYQAEDYAKEMQEKYSHLDFSVTGHSLGGADAQYAAAYTGMDAVTFSAPSILGSLTPEMRRKAEEGEFHDQIINFAHPKDIVGSGTLGGYDGHVGSTYYIDSNYKDANPGDYSPGGIKDKAANSFGGPNYHSLDHYKFEDGYISNPLFDGATGDPVDSPRVPSSSNLFNDTKDLITDKANSLAAFAGAALSAVKGLAAAASAGTIQVTPSELRSVAERWKMNAQYSHAEIEGIRQRLSTYMHSSHSRRLQPIIQQLDTSITSMSQARLQQTNEILYYINHKADLFEQTDNSS
ncbi:lipase family protein [Paenibacillus dakarensis]|uniref:lipase family protein n=1 Tax=Paenibacillus dakarensis TaxID=1527293 RepID=UPI0006D55987